MRKVRHNRRGSKLLKDTQLQCKKNFENCCSLFWSLSTTMRTNLFFSLQPCRECIAHTAVWLPYVCWKLHPPCTPELSQLVWNAAIIIPNIQIRKWRLTEIKYMSYRRTLVTDLYARGVSLSQGCQTHFHGGPHQPCDCLQRAKIMLGLCKCNYSLTVKELKLHSALWRQLWGWYGPRWKRVWHPCFLSRLKCPGARFFIF